jgi:HK97 family phage prohead protease
VETLKELDVVRAAPASVRATRDDAAAQEMPTLVVRFSVFDEWYEINSYWEGEFIERTARGAFAKTIKENRNNVKCLYDHGYDPQIGNKVLGAIDDLREDADAPVGEVPLFDTAYNRDLLPGLEAGVYGSSFRFRVIRDEWNDEPGVSDYNPKGIPERTIKEVRLYEFGPVTFPASPAATAGLRSMTDDFYARSRDRQRVTELEARMRAIRTPSTSDASAAYARTLADDAAAAKSDAPITTDHPSGLSVAARGRILAAPFLTYGSKKP